MTLRSLEPKSSASANSATLAQSGLFAIIARPIGAFPGIVLTATKPLPEVAALFDLAGVGGYGAG